MRRTISLVLAVVCSGVLAGCTPADTKNAPRYAEEVIAKLKDRKYEAIYDGASSDFKRANEKADFVKKMKDLEAFGQLLEATPGGEPTTSKDDGDTVAVVPFATKFTLAEGPLELTLRGNDITGEWEFDYYKYDITATTFDPPYAPTQEGAEKLARRFLYLWQNRRYTDLPTTMRLDEDPEKLRSFLLKLENAGQLLTLTRTKFEIAKKGGRRVASDDYDLKFDNGTGTMNFSLVEDAGEWRIDSVKYNIEYLTSGAPPITEPTKK